MTMRLTKSAEKGVDDRAQKYPIVVQIKTGAIIFQSSNSTFHNLILIKIRYTQFIIA
jgi:hypothetical protein